MGKLVLMEKGIDPDAVEALTSKMKKKLVQVKLRQSETARKLISSLKQC